MDLFWFICCTYERTIIARKFNQLSLFLTTAQNWFIRFKQSTNHDFEKSVDQLRSHIRAVNPTLCSIQAQTIRNKKIMSPD